MSPSLGYRRGKYEERTADAVAIVVHTTGHGPVRRHTERPDRWPTPFDAALWIYSQAMDAGPHYVVGQGGECAQTCPESHVAWHVGGAGSRPYKQAEKSGRPGAWADNEHQWWKKRHAPLQNPRELAGGKLWRSGSCNRNTYGIEVVPPTEGAQREWSPECWVKVAVLVQDIALRRSVPLDRTTVITHSDAHPLARTARGKPWDTPESQWTWRRFCEVASLDPRTGQPVP